ncbi:hypothetical protein BU17DRAFT_69239 [Hysterangium stoloniferum]|nr:hypothetical protein BU17DRAFT_69239 [Hysterangium stoloniferum]
MSTSNETTLSGHDIGRAERLLQKVEWLQPFLSPAALSSEEREEIIDAGIRERLRIKLRYRWSFIEHGDGVCYRVPEDDKHIPLSKDDLEVWVEEWWRGETTCHDPPTIINMRGRSTNATSNIRPHDSHDVDWGAVSLVESSSTSSSITIEPGYFCRVGLEKVGRNVLYTAKTATLMAKLMIYKRMVYGDDRACSKFLQKHLTLPRLGIGRSGIQEVYSGGPKIAPPTLWHIWVPPSTGVPALDGQM